MRRLFVLLCMIALSIQAQDLSSISTLKELQKRSKTTPLQLPESPEIEHPVDENIYVVGPGDVFNLIIGGSEDENHQIMVSPEGTLVVPAVGAIPVAGLTLAEAKKTIIEKLKHSYRADQVFIALMELRTFRVTVSGAVNFPGLVSVNGMARVSDAVFMAGGLVEPPPPFPEPENPRRELLNLPKIDSDLELTEEEYEELKKNIASKRNVLVKRRTGRTVHADLQKYEIAGDLEANPYLVDGDVIVVPTVQEDVGKVSMSGAVRTPGEFEYAPGDKVKDLLDLGHWFTLNADSSKVHIARFVDNSAQVKEIVVELDWSDSAHVAHALATPLRPDDRLFVRSIPRFHEKHTVRVQGEVKYPGDYALLHNPTTLSEVIEMAGGLMDEAALNASYVVRRSYEDRKDNEFDRLQLMTVQEMSRKEIVYFRERAREIEGLISTDFVALFEHGDKSYDITLKDEDMIVVPRKDYTVNVMGHVKNPGLVPYEPNQEAKYYINSAGGYNIDAWKRKTRIKKAGTGEIVSAKNTIVEMGDTIFVPEKLEQENIVRDIALITVQAATVVMLIVQTNSYATRD